MPIFEYKAVYRRQTIQDKLTAGSLDDAKTLISGRGYKIVWLKELTGTVGRSRRRGRISVLEKANFCRYLSTMVEAGLPLTEAIDIYSQDTTNKAFRPVLNETLTSLKKGQTLSLIFSRYPEVFDTLFVSLIRAGEASGTLSKSFDYLARQLFSDYDLRRKVKGALMYPAIVVTAMSFILLLLVFFVLPKIAPIFLHMDLKLPLTTRVVFGLGAWVSEHMAGALAGLAGLAVGLVGICTWRGGRRVLIRGVGLIPQVRRLMDQLDLARFCRIFSTLMASGVPVNEAVVIVFGSLSQPKYKKLAQVFEGEIRRGQQLSQILRQEKIFPKMLVRMIATGEKSGTIDSMLSYMADFYEGEVENELHDLTNLLEPMLMLVVGIGVGVLVLSVIAPIYSLVGSLNM